MRFELPGTPEQVWDAIATARGISSWFLRTDIEERVGGALRIYMGETDSEGTVTGWDPPHRLEYEEYNWAALAGQDDAPVTPLVSEFLVEAQSGGSCVHRVVSSSYGTGADWENEFFEEMAKQWAPFFDNLRLYLTDFPGQQATPLELSATVAGSPDDVRQAMLRALGGREPGDPVDARGVSGRIHRTDPFGVLVRLDAPVTGYLAFYAFDSGQEAESAVSITGWLFSDGAAEYVEAEQPVWQDWLEGLAVTAR
jgi:uncharacterized protein YndB with AHSA1/START domain